MFAAVYFAARYFARRYFPAFGATLVIPAGPGAHPAGRTFTVGADFRIFPVPVHARTFIVPISST